MTLKRKNDSDKIQHKLTPAERYILERAKQRPHQPFCFIDFKEHPSFGINTSCPSVESSARSQKLAKKP